MTAFEPTTGSIVHVEFYPDDLEAFQSFCETVFGWSFERDEEFEYTMWRAPSPPFGGLGEPDDAPVSPPTSLLYISVEDIESTVVAIEAAGGEIVLEEMEIPGVGAMAWFRAPGGLIEAIWEDRSSAEQADESPMFTDEPDFGSITRFELYSDDPAATQAFHESVFGWSFEELDSTYTLARPPTSPLGGLLSPSEEMPINLETGTLLYLLVDSADVSCEQIDAAGASVLVDPFEVQDWGRMGIFEAPGGVVAAVWESAVRADKRDEAEAAP